MTALSAAVSLAQMHNHSSAKYLRLCVCPTLEFLCTNIIGDVPLCCGVKSQRSEPASADSINLVTGGFYSSD